MKFFWKIFLSVFVTFFIALLLISFFTLSRYVSDIENFILHENQTLGRIVSKEIEVVLMENKWPFEMLKQLEKRKDILFWWVVDSDLQINLSNDPKFSNTSALEYFPEISREVKDEKIILNRKKNYGIYVKSFRVYGKKWSFWLGFSLKKIQAHQKKIATLIIGVAFLMLLFLYGILYIVVRGFLRPVMQLRKATSKVGEGNLGFEINIHCNDEIGDLANSFQKMIGDLSSTMVSKNYVDTIITSMMDCLIVTDSKGLIRKVNRATCEYLEMKEEELVGTSLEKILSNNDEIFECLMQEKEIKNKETSFTSSKGEKISVLFNASLMPQGKINDWVCTALDIRKLKEIQFELEEAKLTAERANHAKSQFLATTSHEIRTPMNAIIGMTSLLHETKLDEEQLEFVQTIRYSSEALLTIINDILDFSKIEAGKLEIEHRAFDLRECVESTLDLLNTKAREKKNELSYMIEAHTPTFVMGDITRLRQILVNLVGNAIKFTKNGDINIWVDGCDVDDFYELHFVVKDTGIGIPKDRMHRLFQSFSQVDASTTRKFGGTGLGLAISKRLSEAMGGRMQVVSEVGKGTKFKFSVRVGVVPGAKPLYKIHEQPILENKRLLIVDDNKTNRKILTLYSKNWQIESKAVTSGKEALDLLEKEKFDLAILDMEMPEMDGLMLAKEISKNYDTNKMPLILLSSVDSYSITELKAYFYDILYKPIKSSLLYNCLVQLFAGTDSGYISTSSKKREKEFDAELGIKCPMKILLAEDNPVNQRLAVLMLERLGYKTEVVGNGVEALEAVKRQFYHVVFMDLHMPEMDGLEATRWIRKKISEDKQPIIVAMTADVMVEKRKECEEAGMEAYISKPIRVEELIHSLKECYEKLKNVESRQENMDPEAIENLKKLLGSQANGMVEELLVDFFEDSQVLIENMETALKEKNSELLGRSAHSLKSTSAHFGMMHISQNAKKIEISARENSFENVDKWIELIKEKRKQAEKKLT